MRDKWPSRVIVEGTWLDSLAGHIEDDAFWRLQDSLYRILAGVGSYMAVARKGYRSVDKNQGGGW